MAPVVLLGRMEADSRRHWREIATIQGETFVKTSIKFYKASDKPASDKEAAENSVMDESVDEKAAVEKIELQTGPAHSADQKRREDPGNRTDVASSARSCEKVYIEGDSSSAPRFRT